LVIKIKVVYLHCQTTTTGRLPRTIKRKSKWQQQFTTVYYTQQINRNFRIKINGIVDGKKVNKLVGVKGLIELIGVEMANKMLRRAFNGTDDKTVCKLRRGIKISFYVK
jgi:hypothetical protein